MATETGPFAYAIAEAIAPTWERRRADIEAVAAPVREWLVRELGAGAGDTVLELAAGAGDTGFAAAAGAGRLITTDFSPAMLAAARRRGAELGVANAEFRVMDAERIELPDDAVDGVLCRFGYMLMDHPNVAFAETRRVLRPGGRLALAVWGDPEHNPWLTIAAQSLVRHGHLPPPDPPPAPGPFSLASHARIEALLRGAGFADVRVEEVQSAFPSPGVDEYLGLIADTSGPIGLALGRLAASDRAAIRADAEQALARFATGAGYEVPCVAVCARAG